MKTAIKYFLVCLLLLTAGNTYAAKKTFTKEYKYQASEADSKNTAREIASDEMRKILLREVGTYITEHQKLVQGSKQEYTKTVESITAGSVEMTMLDEQWDGKMYYIKAKMTVDLDDVKKQIDAVYNDKEKMKELEAARKRAQEAEAAMAKLKRETEAQLKQAAKERDEAKRESEKTRVIQIYQDKVVGREENNKGYRYEMQGKYAEAKQSYYNAAFYYNYAPAQYNLGLLYEFGYGVKKSKKDAIFWYRAAAAQGVSEARVRLKKL
ncbi:hypothetical protein SAMD00024442_17_15 [Candidatus Symbiothrix dinenymphae]|nr:hypothetical protein SAMD00024442_17_15 [Candidatus Symbiothrix dinenymphae]